VKILLLGCNGQVGWELQRSLAPLGNITALGRESNNDLHCDLTDFDSLVATIYSLHPDIIVNAAAYTDVDKAESEPALVHCVNTDAPSILAHESQSIGAMLVHYSTDYVFDGGGERPWLETDATDPINIYGASKLEGENAIRNSGCRYLIFRTSWVYASRRTNFIRTILRIASGSDTLKVVSDQFGAPTGADLIADVTAHAIYQTKRQPELAGTYHLAAVGETTWYDYARFIISKARDAGYNIKVTDENIKPINSEDYPTAAARPGNSRLNCRKLEQNFGLKMPDWRNGVTMTLKEILPNVI
jgi:dTDP-4-dehydrorhamnose reductase